MSHHNHLMASPAVSLASAWSGASPLVMPEASNPFCIVASKMMAVGANGVARVVAGQVAVHFSASSFTFMASPGSPTGDSSANPSQSQSYSQSHHQVVVDYLDINSVTFGEEEDLKVLNIQIGQGNESVQVLRCFITAEHFDRFWASALPLIQARHAAWKNANEESSGVDSASEAASPASDLGCARIEPIPSQSQHPDALDDKQSDDEGCIEIPQLRMGVEVDVVPPQDSQAVVLDWQDEVHEVLPPGRKVGKKNAKKNTKKNDAHAEVVEDVDVADGCGGAEPSHEQQDIPQEKATEEVAAKASDDPPQENDVVCEAHQAPREAQPADADDIQPKKKRGRGRAAKAQEEEEEKEQPSPAIARRTRSRGPALANEAIVEDIPVVAPIVAPPTKGRGRPRKVESAKKETTDVKQPTDKERHDDDDEGEPNVRTRSKSVANAAPAPRVVEVVVEVPPPDEEAEDVRAKVSQHLQDETKHKTNASQNDPQGGTGRAKRAREEEEEEKKDEDEKEEEKPAQRPHRRPRLADVAETTQSIPNPDANHTKPSLVQAWKEPQQHQGDTATAQPHNARATRTFGSRLKARIVEPPKSPKLFGGMQNSDDSEMLSSPDDERKPLRCDGGAGKGKGGLKSKEKAPSTMPLSECAASSPMPSMPVWQFDFSESTSQEEGKEANNTKKVDDGIRASEAPQPKQNLGKKGKDAPTKEITADVRTSKPQTRGKENKSKQQPQQQQQQPQKAKEGPAKAAQKQTAKVSEAPPQPTAVANAGRRTRQQQNDEQNNTAQNAKTAHAAKQHTREAPKDVLPKEVPREVPKEEPQEVIKETRPEAQKSYPRVHFPPRASQDSQLLGSPVVAPLAVGLGADRDKREMSRAFGRKCVQFSTLKASPVTSTNVARLWGKRDVAVAAAFSDESSAERLVVAADDRRWSRYGVEEKRNVVCGEEERMARKRKDRLELSWGRAGDSEVSPPSDCERPAYKRARTVPSVALGEASPSVEIAALCNHFKSTVRAAYERKAQENMQKVSEDAKRRIAGCATECERYVRSTRDHHRSSCAKLSSIVKGWSSLRRDFDAQHAKMMAKFDEQFETLRMEMSQMHQNLEKNERDGVALERAMRGHVAGFSQVVSSNAAA